MRKVAVVVLAMLMATSSVFATVLKQEGFNYPNGNLVGNDTWTAFSSGGSTPIQVTNGAITLNQGSGSREDDASPYASLLVQALLTQVLMSR